MNVGIVCYPTFGGSGVVATEIGLALAQRGHRVHLFAYACPARLGHLDSSIVFHHVEVRDYPVFHQPPYTLALTSRIVDVAQQEPLDVLHVHYAVPHATSAYLAKEVLGARAPKVVTTLHGTDITLVGSDPSYRPITRFSIEKSDAVTTPSRWLRDETHRRFDIATPIEVIPNFVDAAWFVPQPRLSTKANARSHMVHVSNFRPVKRVDDVVRIFAAVRREQPATLTLVGDGPERAAIEYLVDTLGVTADVTFLGASDDFRAALGTADVFLLPSETESFGVAALEAQAMGVPVVASDVGGLPEVIVHGATGLLCPVGDVAAFASATLSLVRDPKRREAMGTLARERAVEHFHMASVIDAYERLYRRLVD